MNGIRMDGDGSSAEGLLELLEGRSSFAVPRQRPGFFMEHANEGGRETMEALDEFVIEVGES